MQTIHICFDKEQCIIISDSYYTHYGSNIYYNIFICTYSHKNGVKMVIHIFVL